MVVELTRRMEEGGTHFQLTDKTRGTSIDVFIEPSDGKEYREIIINNGFSGIHSKDITIKPLSETKKEAEKKAYDFLRGHFEHLIYLNFYKLDELHDLVKPM